ncbi:MAG: preprotein translocase subunit SecG [Candidatus Pacebacteria bacterium]|nr:preprotein translocase subunit SecG [Candidatus Paceibacterota bacterium]
MNWLSTIIAIISVLLIILVLLQKTNTDGAGLGGGDSLGISNKKRGLEKTLFKFTIIVAIIFVLINFIALFVK